MIEHRDTTSSTTKQRYARIMVECGCSVEDVAITFKWTIERALAEVAPALKCNQAAREFARRRHGQTMAREKTPAIHRRPVRKQGGMVASSNRIAA